MEEEEEELTLRPLKTQPTLCRGHCGSEALNWSPVDEFRSRLLLPSRTSTQAVSPSGMARPMTT